MKNLLTVVSIILLILLINTARAATINLGWPDSVVFDSQGNPYHVFRDNAPRPVYPDLYNQPKAFNAPLGGGKPPVPMTVPYRIPVKLANVGKAATNFLKRAGPIAVILGLKELVCDLSDICTQDTDGDGQPDQFAYRTPAPAPTSSINYWFHPSLTAKFASAQLAGQQWSTNYPDYDFDTCQLNSFGDAANCILRAKSNPSATVSFTVYKDYGCPDNYTVSGGQCLSTQAASFRPLTEQDWTDAEPKLSTPSIVEKLRDAHEPIPVDDPVITPTTKSGESKTTTVRNGSGTATGTQTETTTVTATPVAGQPNVVNVTSRTTITNTDITNNTTTTTETDSNPAEPEEPEPPEVSIDDVPDVDLPTYTNPTTYSHTSWGEGSCPPNPVFTAFGEPHDIPLQTVCEGMTTIRPAVILLFMLVSLYIISGVGVKVND